MKRIETISVEECAKRLNKDPNFIRNAVEQRVFPGSCIKNENGRRSVVIPRKAFEDYMTKWNPNPTVELIQALIEAVQKKILSADKTTTMIKDVKNISEQELREIYQPALTAFMHCTRELIKKIDE